MKACAQLSEDERATLQALYRVGPSDTALARILCLHVNTVKYRMGRIREKYGMPAAPQSSRWELLREAMTRGDVTTLDGQVMVEAFVQHVATRLPTGQGTPLATALRTWLCMEAEQFLAERRLAS